MDKVKELFNIINNSHKIVFFTGAGISTDSGLSDFRHIYSKSYKGIKPENILTKGFLEKYPDIFFKFVKDYFLIKTKPNVTHEVIADISNKTDKDVCIITQNIDGLHQKAGSKLVLEIHGSINKWYCTDCKKPFSMDDIQNLDSLKCQEDDCNGFIRPNIILYNENFNPMILRACKHKLEEADTLIIAGTSLRTLLAYEIVKHFKGKTVFINHPLKKSLPKKMDLEIYDDISNVFEKLRDLENEENYFL